jgi:hypothetical protein
VARTFCGRIIPVTPVAGGLAASPVPDNRILNDKAMAAASVTTGLLNNFLPINSSVPIFINFYILHNFDRLRQRIMTPSSRELEWLFISAMDAADPAARAALAF